MCSSSRPHMGPRGGEQREKGGGTHPPDLTWALGEGSGGKGKAGREAAVPITVPHHGLQRLVKAKRYLSTEASEAGFPPPATHLCPRPSITPARRTPVCSEGGEREGEKGRERERER